MAASPRPPTADDLWRLRRVGPPVPAPDGSFAVVGVTTYDVDKNEGREQLHLVASRGGPPRPLTTPEVSSSCPVISPDGRTLAFLRKPAGGDRPQLHVMPLDGGEARCVTSLPLGVMELRFCPDGRHAVVLSPVYREERTLDGTRRLAEERAKRPVRPFATEDRLYRFWDRWLDPVEVHHLFCVDLATGEARDLMPDSTRWFDLMDPTGQFDISPDGEEVAFSADVSSPPHDRLRYAIFTVPLRGGEVRCLTPEHPSDDVRPRYSPDGHAILYGTKRVPDHYPDRVRLARFERATGESRILTEGWDRSASWWEFSGPRTLVVEAEDRARCSLFELSAVEETTSPRLLARGGTFHAPRPAGGVVFALYHSLTEPPEAVRVTRDGVVERITGFTDAWRESALLAPVEEHVFPGAEGEPCQMFVLRPPDAPEGARLPLVHLIHGGPYGCFADMWHFRWCAQLFAAMGYAVALVNFHGSSSFGQAFADSILGDWGGKPARDVLCATDRLVELGVADPARVAVAGGSYGGYLTLWLVTQTDRFACAVSHAPVYNLFSAYATDMTQGMEREFCGEPWGSPERRAALRRHSPADHAAGLATPTLLLHGEKDYRCPLTQALEAYGVLKAKGVPARLVHYPDENHWILKPQNSLHWYDEVRAWLARHLAGETNTGA